MKRILLIIICLLTFVSPVYAYEINFVERNSSNNYGIRKNNVDIESNKNDILNTPLVSNTELNVYDFANILSKDEELYIRSGAKTLQAETDWEIVFYVISDNNVYSRKLENKKGADFYKYNSFGLTNGKYYNGVVFVLNVINGGNNGYYDLIPFGDAQYYLDDERIESILTAVDTEFEQHRYKDMLSEVISNIRVYHQKGMWENDGSWQMDDNGYLIYIPSIPYFIIFVISFGIAGIVCGVLYKKNKMVRKSYNATSYIDVNDRAFSRRQDVFKNSRTTSYTVNSPSSTGGSRTGRSTGHRR